MQSMGIKADAPEWAADREMTIEAHKKSTRKIACSIDFDEKDNQSETIQAMRNHGWHLQGKQANTKCWTQVFSLPKLDRSDVVNDAVDHYETMIRSLKSQDGQDAGWRILDSDKAWVARNRTAASDMLENFGVPSKATKGVIAKLQYRNWTLQNLPFQPEFPGGRSWNIGAQLAYQPTKEDRPMVHPHWDMIFNHLGKGLDDAVAPDSWCRMNGVTRGATYLLYWCASMIQQPAQSLPYLFLFGPEETGKSSLHNALGFLMSKGHVEGRNSLLTQHLLTAFQSAGAGGVSRRSNLAAHMCAVLEVGKMGALAPIFPNLAGRHRSAIRHGVLERGSSAGADERIEQAWRL